jgi:uncharacterized protein YjeT (DUF2065 family)
MGAFILYAVYPFLSALCLIILGVVAVFNFPDNLTRIVGIGGLVIGIVFFRPKGWGMPMMAAPAE